MARIRADGLPTSESLRDRLLREGRMALRVGLEERFRSRTPEWRKAHEYPSAHDRTLVQIDPGEGRVVPTQDDE